MQIRKNNKNGFNSSLKLRTFQKKKLTYFRLGIAAYVTFNSFDGIKKKKVWIAISWHCEKVESHQKNKIHESHENEIIRIFLYFESFPSWFSFYLKLLVKVLGLWEIRKNVRERERGRRRSEEAPLRDKKKVMGFGV